MLCIGPKGSGKSLAVNYTLSLYAHKFKMIKILGKFAASEAMFLRCLLDHFEETTTSANDEDDALPEDNYLIQQLTTLTEHLTSQKQCVVFVLDDFEVIARHATKTLYHILDAAHLRKVHMFVIALTSSVV